MALLCFVALTLNAACEQPKVLPSVRPAPAPIPEFSGIKDAKEKKNQFFAYMRPIIEKENERIIRKRERLLALHQKHIDKEPLSGKDLRFINRLFTEYEVNRTSASPDYAWTVLLRRVDILPVELAMVQAAKESAWGTSRFAQKANNMFGQWCFVKGCGLVPKNRIPGSKHEVKKFRSANESVRAYMHNLNTFYAYNELRSLRFKQRQSGLIPDFNTLLPGLISYSEQGEIYIEELRAMLQANRTFIGS